MICGTGWDMFGDTLGFVWGGLGLVWDGFESPGLNSHQSLLVLV